MEAKKKEEMSVYGGDSWGREAQHRKRRVDDLMLDKLTRDSYKQLSNGNYICLVCPNKPLFDSSLALSMHTKGSRHVAADSRLKERELKDQEEIKKRIALSDSLVNSACLGSSHQVMHPKDKQMHVGNSGSFSSTQQVYLKSKPLIERTIKAAAEALRGHMPERNIADGQRNVKRKNTSFFLPDSPSIPKQRTETLQTTNFGTSCLSEQASGWATETSIKMLEEHQLEMVEHHERELKFTAAGWKRDCNGTWFRDENAEFDSDEEDPNVCLL